MNHATKALNDLYGNTLKGLVKSGGIRLSYSKNPLGVRTPTSAGSTGPVLQQQQSQTTPQQAAFTVETSFSRPQQLLGDEQSQRPATLRRDVSMTSPPPNAAHPSTFLTSPPPRFYSSSPSSTAFGTTSVSSSTPLSGASNAFLPRSSNGLYGYSLGSGNPSSTFSPFGLSTSPHSMIPEHQGASPDEHPPRHFIHRTLSPPANNVEAARAG